MLTVWKRLLFVLLILTLIPFAQAQDDGSLLPITEDMTYTVRPADTLETIGALFDVLPACIAEMNGIDHNNRINVGDELLISIDCPFYDGEATVTTPREVTNFVDDCEGYRVQRLDTLDVIGQGIECLRRFTASCQ